ncbi:MAG: DegT/DnrJ/EryC1/StrS aminotransferase family protein [Myxococcota bacterium]|nr:DegT/DnrJ/EryC1/StrS aminotransferase family protein [Myxococcota bacterium]
MSNIPFVDLATQYERLKQDIDAGIQRVLEHGRFIMGPEVSELEAALCEFAGCRHAITCASGTDALSMALMAEGIGPGDAVFLPAFTFTASAEVVLLAGAEPVFVDVEPRSFNLDPGHLREQIEATTREGRLRPHAIIAVDLFGLPADHAAIADVADERDLFVIADAAQSFGGRIGEARVGTHAPVTATSFYPAKPLGCFGDGGAVFTDDDDRADVLRSIRTHGEGTGQHEIVRIGLNGRLDTMQAAILLPKLAVFASELEARARLADRYDQRLAGAVTTPIREAGKSSAWAQYSILLDDRDRVQQALRTAGIPSAIYYPIPMHLQPAYAAYGRGEGSLPVSEALSKRILSLPMHPYLDDATADRICDTVLAAVGGA